MATESSIGRPDFEEFDKLTREYRESQAQCQSSMDQLQASVREMMELAIVWRDDLELRKADLRDILNRGRKE
jgi:hypothetical protein